MSKEKRRAESIAHYLNTSVDDMKISIATVTDAQLLIRLLQHCRDFNYVSKVAAIEARICKLIKAGADHV